MDRIYPFKDCVGTHIVLNPRHVQNRDWSAVADYTNLETPSAWKKIPLEDSCDYFEKLIKEDGLSYAFVSLLQVCRRNNIDWIYFTWTAPIAGGLEVFNDDWPNLRERDKTKAA